MAQKTFLRPFSSKRLLRRRADDKLSCEAVALELVRLLPTGRKNANHDGVTQQICDRLRDFETENQMLIQTVAAVHQARQKEDAAYRRFSGKDFASDDLRAADQLEDKYMSAIHNILNGLLYLPDK